MEIKVIDNKTVTVDGTAYSWRIRPDGSIKVSSGLGGARKLVKDFIQKHISAGASTNPQPVAATVVQPSQHVTAGNLEDTATGSLNQQIKQAPLPINQEVSEGSLLQFLQPEQAKVVQQTATTMQQATAELVLTDAQQKAFAAVVKNVMDNSGGAFGWVDQSKPLNTTEAEWEAQVDELVALQMLHRLKNSRNDVLFTGKGTHMALKLKLISHRNYSHIVLNDLAYVPQ